MKTLYFSDRPAFVRNIEIEDDILELDGFVVTITDSNSCNINLTKGGEEKMTEREVLEIVINSNKQDLANAISARDSIATENVETKIEAKLAEARKTISETEYAEHDRNLADANKVIELMNILITRKENALAELVAAEEQVVVNQNIEEGV